MSDTESETSNQRDERNGRRRARLESESGDEDYVQEKETVGSKPKKNKRKHDDIFDDGEEDSDATVVPSSKGKKAKKSIASQLAEDLGDVDYVSGLID